MTTWFTDFFEQRGDRASMDDGSIVAVLPCWGPSGDSDRHRKGKTLEENVRCNFGMPQPEGYRKAMRLMRQAEKFGRPVITFVDTPGAYPGLEAERHGQGEAIAQSIMLMSSLTVPVITLVTGEGSSGGALAISVANSLWMLENAVYSVLSPEGFAAILWKDGSRGRRRSRADEAHRPGAGCLRRGGPGNPRAGAWLYRGLHRLLPGSAGAADRRGRASQQPERRRPQQRAI